MKKYLLMLVALLGCMHALAQNNSITVSAGYVYANIKDFDTDASGWRLNGVYEINPVRGNLVHGVALGHIRTSAKYSELSGTEVIDSKVKISTWAFYYAPKLWIGDGSVKGFVKGAAGMQFSSLKRTGDLPDFSSSDAGFYGGLGAGLMKTINDEIFINLEYEWAYQSNSYYRDGFLHSFMAGVGFYLN